MSEKFDVNKFIEDENRKIIDNVEGRIEKIIRRYQNCEKEKRPQDIENFEKTYGKFCLKDGISDEKLKSYLNLTDKTKEQLLQEMAEKINTLLKEENRIPTKSKKGGRTRKRPSKKGKSRRNTRKKRTNQKGGARLGRELEILLFKLAKNMDHNGHQIYEEGLQTSMALSILEKDVNINAQHNEDEMYDIMDEKNITTCEEEEWIKPNFTALHYACYYDEINMVDLLIGEGANIHIMDKYGKTPLHIACQQGNINIIKRLLEYGANINFGTDLSETPLHSAILSDDNIDKKMEVVTTLLDSGADINALDSKGQTPLNIAVINQYDEELKSEILYLIEKGADVNIGDKKGNTPLHYAINFMNNYLAIALIDNGADYDAKNNKGKTAIQGDDHEDDDNDRVEFLEWRQGIINHIRNLPKSQERRTMLSLGNRDPKSPLSRLGKDNITEINKLVIGGKLKNKKTRKKRNKK